ncbi:MAG: spore coat associated protein CotJA [Paludibacteraceae bacterium]|nr:spore coat associated protein CotJA [Paludibacteraceae bacterium]
MTDKDQSFDIECVTELLCGKKDDWVLAMAYVPWQEWRDLYAEELALQKGTLFAELDKPFLGGKQVHHGKR